MPSSVYSNGRASDEQRLANLNRLMKMLKPAPAEWFKDIQVSEVSGSRTEAWGEPALVDGLSDVPAFPLDVLPGGLRDWVAAVAENSQTPNDLAAMMGLTAVAVAVAKKVVIQPYLGNKDYDEPANIWTCIPMRSGNRKTFVVSQARCPFDSYLERFKKEKSHDHAVKRQELAALEKKKADLTDKLAKAKDDKEYAQVKNAIGEVIKRASQIDVYVPRLFADDVTPERLAVLMSQHHGRIAILTDEGGCFDHFAGIYNKKLNLDVYLHGHSGGTLYRDRQSNGEEIVVKQAALTIGVSPQPQVIEGMGSKDRLLGRGLLARFLWSFPKTNLGQRDWEPDPIPNKAKLGYSATIAGLLGWAPESTVRLSLSSEAFDLWLGFAKRNETQLGDGKELSSPGIQEWANKLPGAVARLAMLLHCVSSPGGKIDATIAGAAMRSAIAIGDYLVPHAHAAFKVLRTDPESEAARILQRWISNLASQGESRFTKSQAQQNHKHRFPNVSDVDRPIKILCDRQICRPLPSESKPGRPSAWYEINPRLG